MFALPRLSAVTLLLTFAGASLAASKPELILSTDVGNEIDDQWAIAYMLTSERLNVKGIMSAHAPSLPAPSAHATYRILVDEVETRLGLHEHPPLLEGSSTPLARLNSPQDSDASRFLLDQSRGYSKEHRLLVLVIGAATDIASALIDDPGLADRIEVIAMGFKNISSDGGKEYNVENDPLAWQVILQSSTPVTIGSADICRQFLAMPFDKAAALLSRSGPVGLWLWSEFQSYYFRNIKPLRVDDFSKPWIIWDIITLAYVEGLAKTDHIPRPVLGNDGSFAKGPDEGGTAQWITAVDSTRLWEQFGDSLKQFSRTHELAISVCGPPLQ